MTDRGGQPLTRRRQGHATALAGGALTWSSAQSAWAVWRQQRARLPRAPPRAAGHHQPWLLGLASCWGRWAWLRCSQLTLGRRRPPAARPCCQAGCHCWHASTSLLARRGSPGAWLGCWNARARSPLDGWPSHGVQKPPSARVGLLKLDGLPLANCVCKTLAVIQGTVSQRLCTPVRSRAKRGLEETAFNYWCSGLQASAPLGASAGGPPTAALHRALAAVCVVS